MSLVTNFPAGVEPVGPFVPGDFFVVCDWNEDWLGRLIRAGSRVRYGNTDHARWSHSGLIVGADGAIVEAEAQGVQLNNISKYQEADLYIVHTKASVEQAKLMVAQAYEYVGVKYDVLDFIALGTQLAFSTKLAFHVEGRFICSALVARCTEKCIVKYHRSPEDMLPADLTWHWGVETGQPLPSLNWFDHLLNGVAAVTGFIRNIFSRS
jgi:hypothetical protein